jgi:hypothetical protein
MVFDSPFVTFASSVPWAVVQDPSAGPFPGGTSIRATIEAIFQRASQPVGESQRRA